MKMPCGLTEVFIEDELIDSVYEGEKLDIQYLIEEKGVLTLQNISKHINQYVLLRGICDNKKTVLVKVDSASNLKKISNTKEVKLLGLSPRDAKQACFVDSIADEKTLLTTGIGPAGTGKSTLAVAYGLEKVVHENKTMYMCKSTALVGRGKTFGAVPGDVNEKFAPHVASYRVILEKLLGDRAESYIKLMEQKGKLKFIPVEYARGMTFEDCTFIIDEVQNLDWHELKTICSRMGDGANLILLGDLEQIDTKAKSFQTGIYRLLNSDAYKRSPITSVITLDQQYRGPIPTLMSDIDKEFKRDDDD